MALDKISARLHQLEEYRRNMILPDGRCSFCATQHIGRLVFVLPEDGRASIPLNLCPACGEDANTYFIISEAADPRLAPVDP